MAMGRCSGWPCRLPVAAPQGVKETQKRCWSRPSQIRRPNWQNVPANFASDTKSMPSAHRRLCRSAQYGRNENGLGQSTTKPRPAAALPPLTEDQSPVSCCKQEGAAAFGQRSNHVLLQLVTRLRNRAHGRGRGQAGRGEAKAGALVRNKSGRHSCHGVLASSTSLFYPTPPFGLPHVAATEKAQQRWALSG